MDAHQLESGAWLASVDGDTMVAATELHSADDSLFELVFPRATERRAVEGSGTL